MKNKHRDKKSCYRCRALTVDTEGIKCSLGYRIEALHPFEFYRPCAGQTCSKPLTFAALVDAVARHARAEADNKQSTLFAFIEDGKIRSTVMR